MHFDRNLLCIFGVEVSELNVQLVSIETVLRTEIRFIEQNVRTFVTQQSTVEIKRGT